MQQDQTKPMELYAMAAELGSSKAHYNLGIEYHQRGDSKKAKFHYKTAAMAGTNWPDATLVTWRQSPEILKER